MSAAKKKITKGSKVATKSTTKTATKDTKKAGGVCLFSGSTTGKPSSRFLPGNDAKLKSVLLKVARGELKTSDIPAPAASVLRKDGLWGYTLEGSTLTAPKGAVLTKSAAPAKKKAADKKDDAPKRNASKVARRAQVEAPAIDLSDF